MRENLIKAAENRVDSKIASLKQLQTQIQGLLQQHDDAQQKEIDSLVKTYASMKPKDAARIFNNLDDGVLLSVACENEARRSGRDPRADAARCRAETDRQARGQAQIAREAQAAAASRGTRTCTRPATAAVRRRLPRLPAARQPRRGDSAVSRAPRGRIGNGSATPAPAAKAPENSRGKRRRAGSGRRKIDRRGCGGTREMAGSSARAQTTPAGLPRLRARPFRGDRARRPTA